MLVWLCRHQPSKANTRDLVGYEVIKVAFRYTSWQQAYQDIIFACGGRWPDVIAYVINDRLEKGFVRFIESHMPKDVVLLRMWTKEGEAPQADSKGKVWFIRTSVGDGGRVVRQSEMFDLQAYRETLGANHG